MSCDDQYDATCKYDGYDTHCYPSMLSDLCQDIYNLICHEGNLIAEIGAGAIMPIGSVLLLLLRLFFGPELYLDPVTREAIEHTSLPEALHDAFLIMKLENPQNFVNISEHDQVSKIAAESKEIQEQLRLQKDELDRELLTQRESKREVSYASSSVRLFKRVESLDEDDMKVPLLGFNIV